MVGLLLVLVLVLAGPLTAPAPAPAGGGRHWPGVGGKDDDKDEEEGGPPKARGCCRLKSVSEHCRMRTLLHTAGVSE